ncbi:DDE-type integrase/transposase/recombinase [Streptomyces sp. NPDC014733]|uniref:DDE-type integrase/transposase/recombinase n=1 Tax=Streptomyces sp. NPDC014733 TaxID=3364885 RepID=UPI0036FFEE0D
MRKFRTTGIRLRKRVHTTVPEPSATPVPDLFPRGLTAPVPDLKCRGDVTYLPVGDGERPYLATVLDCFSRRIAGRPIADRMRTDPVAAALKAAAHARTTKWRAVPPRSFHIGCTGVGHRNRGSAFPVGAAMSALLDDLPIDPSERCTSFRQG